MYFKATARELFILQITKKPSPKNSAIGGWSKQVKAAVNRKQKAFQKYKATASHIHSASLDKADNILCKILNYKSQLIANMKTKLRCFCCYLRSQKKVKDHIDYLSYQT